MDVPYASGLLLMFAATTATQKCNFLDLFQIPGDVVISCIFDLHEGSINGSVCETFHPTSIQTLEAAIWTINNLNKINFTRGIKLGIEVLDTCGKSSVATKRILEFLQTVQPFYGTQEPCLKPHSLSLGIIGPTTLQTQIIAADLLATFKLPHIFVSPDTSYFSDQIKYSNVLHSSTQSLTNYINVLIEVLIQLHWTHIIVLTSPTIYGQTLSSSFRNIAYIHGICIAAIEELPQGTKDQSSYKNVLIKIKSLGINGILVFASNFEIKMVFHAAKTFDLNSFYWIVSDAFRITSQNLIGLENTAAGMLTVQPSFNEIVDFKHHFIDLVSGKLPKNNILMNYISDFYSCRLTNQNSSCNTVNVNTYTQDPSVEYVIKSVYLLATALRNVHNNVCNNHKGLCSNLINLTPKVWMNYLKNVSYTFSYPGLLGLKNKTTRFYTKSSKYKYHFDYKVYHYKKVSRSTFNFIQIGSSAGGHITLKTNLLQSYFPNGTEKSKEYFYPSSKCPYKRCQCLSQPLSAALYINESSMVIQWRADTWITIVTTVATMGILFTLILLLYIISKLLFSKKIKGNQIVGILLLIGIMMLYSSVIPYGFQPTEATCGMRMVTVGISYAFCFSIMLSRIIMLIASETEDGPSGHISGFIQIILFFFMLLVQVAISLEYWLLKYPRVQFVYNDDDNIIAIKCSISMLDFFVSLIYVKFLLFLLCLTSLFTVGEKRTYREGLLFNIASLIAVGLWIAWSVVYGVADGDHKEASICVGLLATASILLVTIFFPRIYMIISSSKVDCLNVPTQHNTFSGHHNSKTISFDNNGYDEESDDDKPTKLTKL